MRRIQDQMGPGKAELLQAAGTVPPAIAEAVLDVLREPAARSCATALAWRLPDHHPVLAPLDEARVAADQASAVRGRFAAAQSAGTGGGDGDLAPEEMEALLQRLERFGRLIGVASNRFFLPETIVALGEIAGELAAGAEEAGFTAAEFNKRSGIGRNLTIIVLEYLDDIGVTHRSGDLRHVVRSAHEAMG